MLLRYIVATLLLSCSSGFVAPIRSQFLLKSLTKLRLTDESEILEQIKALVAADYYPEEDVAFENIVKDVFPGAISNKALESTVVDTLSTKGFTEYNTLLATSLGCDELARRLENDFSRSYGKGYSLGGLGGFPFAGNAGFEAMTAHIPDDGYCLLVYGPHVGITQDGLIGKVEREGVSVVNDCCDVAIGASEYVQDIMEGRAPITTPARSLETFQQDAIQELLLPHGKRLQDAGDLRMRELPYVLFESLDVLMMDLLSYGRDGLKQGTAILGGIQINTSPDSMDYFHPLRFDYMDADGEIVEDLLSLLASVSGTL